MITGTLKGKVDRVWDAFWSGGISNPLEVIEQITYLLFMRQLDDRQALAENRARHTKQPLETRIFAPDEQLLRWSRLRDLEPGDMYERVSEEVFPFLRRSPSVSQVPLRRRVSGSPSTSRNAATRSPTPASPLR